MKPGSGELSQQLRACTALAEGPSSVPSTPVRQFTIVLIPALRDVILLASIATCTYVYKSTHRHIHRDNFEMKRNLKKINKTKHSPKMKARFVCNLQPWVDLFKITSFAKAIGNTNFMQFASLNSTTLPSISPRRTCNMIYTFQNSHRKCPH